ncbi:MAG: hypothetical protein NT004_07435 [Bacteroidetes bacterium]|nr:hypothetical protein [Bacteroidota bacterium]
MRRLHILFLLFLSTAFHAQSTQSNCGVNTVCVSGNIQNRNASLNGVIIASGQSQVYRAHDNISISGSNPVTVNQKGSITLIAGKSILLLPGTRISYGGFMYATIGTNGKSGKQAGKEVSLVTIEENEKIEELATLALSVALFTPFSTCNNDHLYTGDAEQGSFDLSNNVLSAISPEQQRKVAVDSYFRAEVSHRQMLINYSSVLISHENRAETMRVLRL